VANVTRIVITPGPLELALNGPAYTALVEDLREQGYEAELEPPLEERSGLPQEFIALAMTLSEYADDVAVNALVQIVLDRMRRSRERPPKPPPRPPNGKLYGPNGEVLWEGEIPDQDSPRGQDPGTNSR